MQLRAGEISVLYEDGFLRYINYGDAEIVRMVYFALRDGNWGTLDAVITNEQIYAGDRSFTITYNCTHHQQDTTICTWKVKIEGDTDGNITYEVIGRYLVDFKKNRAGLCILHPAGGDEPREIGVIHADGSYEQTLLPQFVAAHNPFKQISALRIKKGVYWYKLDLEGDTFEMEDQRSWTDSTFKTFCTPLGLPFPVSVKAGDEVHQRITFTPESILPALGSNGVKPIEISISHKVNTLPQIGVGKSTTVAGTLPDEVVTLLKQLQLSHYQTDVDLTVAGWIDAFATDIANTQALGLLLKVNLILGDDIQRDSHAFISFCTQHKVGLHSVLLLSKGQLVSGRELVAYAETFSEQLPGAVIGIGSLYNFTEINRHCYQPGKGQFLSFAIHPQEHAFDDLTMVENIAGQTETVKTAKHIFGSNIAVHISPLTLRRRYNPYATDPAAVLWSSEQRADPRQKTAMGALYLLGSIKALANSGVKSVTCFQTVGDEGLMSENEEPFPVYHVLKQVAQTGTRHAIATISSQPLLIDCLLFDNSNMLLWNYTQLEQQVQFPDGRSIKLLPQQILELSGFAQNL